MEGLRKIAEVYTKYLNPKHSKTIKQKIIEVCNKKIEAKGTNIGLSFYAFFANKKDGKFKAWDDGVNGCISCHSAVKDSDYLFTKLQATF